jgi:hypothetical protein
MPSIHEINAINFTKAPTHFFFFPFVLLLAYDDGCKGSLGA